MFVSELSHLRLRSISFVFVVFAIILAAQFVSAQSIQDSYVTSLASAAQCGYANAMAMDSKGATFLSCSDGVKLVNGTSITQVGNSSILFQFTSALYYDDRTQWLYIASQALGIFRWSQSTATAEFLLNDSQCPFPKALIPSYVGSHSLIVACLDSGIFRIDLANLTTSLLVNSTECSGPLDVITYAELGDVYITAACRDSGVVRKNLNTLEVTVLADPDTCDSPTSVTRDDNGILFASCRDTGVLEFTNAGLRILPIEAECSSAYLVWSLPQFGFTLVDCAYSGLTATFEYNNQTLAINIATHDFCDTARDVRVVDGFLYIACYNSGLVKISSKSVSALTSFAQCRNPNGLAVDRTTGALIASCATGVISVNGKLIHTIANSSVCNNAYALSWTQPEVSDRIVVSCGTQQTLSSVNTSTITVMVNLTDAMCDSVSSFLLDSTSNQIYVSCTDFDYTIVSFDLTTKVMKPVVPVASCDIASGMYLDTNTGLLYSACFNYGILTIDSGGTITTVVNSTDCTTASSVVIHNGYMYLACFQGLLRANLDGSNIITLVDGQQCVGPNTVSVDLLTGNIFVACVTIGGVWVVDGTTGVASELLTATQCPSAWTLLPDPNTRISFAACSSRAIVAVTTDFRCSSGTSWNAGSCIACDPHWYRSAGDLRPLGPCIACSDGYIAPQYGSTSCTPCPAGSYDSNKNCLLCPVGKFQPLSAATSCNDCAKGSYAVQPGSTQCTLCEAGSFSTHNASVSCSPCNSGSASDKIGLDQPCDGCPAGKYQAIIGQTECLPCPNHFYSEQANSTSCTRCANQVNEDRTSCTIVTCDANSEFDDNSNQCELCPLSQYSSRGGLCSTCVINSYTPASGSGCAPCDGIEGLVCSGGIAEVKPGYWAFISDSMDSTWIDPANPMGHSYQRFQTARCPFCPGTKLQLLQVLNTSSSANSTSPADYSIIQYCAFPRLNSVNNTLCARCEEGYLAWGDSCLQCDKANGSLVFGYLVLSFALVLFLFYSSTSTSSAGSMAIFLFFIQTAALEVGPIVHYIDWIQIANFDPKSAGSCLAPWSAYGQTLFALLIPIILIAELMIIAVIHYILLKMTSSDSNSESTALENKGGVRGFKVRLRRFSLDDYFVGILSILLFCYTQVSTASLRYLHCVDVGSERLNFSAPTIHCRSNEYKAYLAPVLIAVIAYVFGFPIVALVKLWRNRESLYTPTTDEPYSSSASSITAPAMQSFLHHWSPFYRMYARHAWFWQCGVLLRRAAFVVTAVLLVQEPSQRFMVFAFLHFTSLLIHIYTQPYEQKQLNHMETASYVLLVCISLLLTGYLPPYPLLIQLFLFFLIVPPAICMFGVILMQRYQVWREGQHLTKMKFPEAAIDATLENGSTIAVSDASESTAVEMPSMTPTTVAPNVAESILPAYALDSEQERL